MNLRSLAMCSLLLVFLGCLGGWNKGDGVLSERQALELAVELANDRCDKLYSERPFDAQSYRIVFKEDRWHWGQLDIHGEHGYSAVVSFGASGDNRVVEVYLSVDRPATTR